MKIAYRAVWTIESRLREPLSLETVGARLGVSTFHLARAFSASHGMTLMQYVRRRRLTEAAQQLLESDTRIIDVALDAGYGSQEAFTRAFSAEFHAPPQAFRHHHRNQPFKGMEAILMEPNSTIKLKPPRIVSLDALRLIGLSRRYNEQTSAQIPDQWAQFNQLHVVQTGEAAYGVCYNNDTEGNLDYFCGIDVTTYRGPSEDHDRLTVPAQTYAVFRHDGHISEIRDVWKAIWNEGLVNAQLTVSEGPQFEKYGPEFDPQTGNGGYEIWIPIEKP